MVLARLVKNQEMDEEIILPAIQSQVKNNMFKP